MGLRETQRKKLGEMACSSKLSSMNPNRCSRKRSRKFQNMFTIELTWRKGAATNLERREKLSPLGHWKNRRSAWGRKQRKKKKTGQGRGLCTEKEEKKRLQPCDSGVNDCLRLRLNENIRECPATIPSASRLAHVKLQVKADYYRERTEAEHKHAKRSFLRKSYKRQSEE